jgi:glutamyl-tRNA reductase
MTQIITVGTSHHIAPVDFRERLAFSEDQILESFRVLRETHHIRESAILSTCNRVEVYAITGRKDGVSALHNFLSDFRQIDPQELKKFTYHAHDSDAVRHLFRVAASLDSMVVGEAQILAQVKEAYDTALSAGATDTVLNRLFTKALSVGKRIRTETSIASGAVSISYAAVELAKKIFQSLEDKTVAIIGAGEMSELTAQHLVENGVSKVLVANRTYERAVKIAEKFNGIPLALSDDLSFLVDVDIVISSTNAPHYLIRRQPLAEIMRKRKHRYMFLIDIAVPRDIDPDVGKIDTAFLYNIDDLEEVVASNLQERQREATLAERIIEEETTKFLAQLQTLEVNPTIKALHQQFGQIAAQELETCFTKAKLSPKQQKMVASMTQAITKKLLHPPTQNLRRAVNDIDSDHVQYVRALQELFGLEQAGDDEVEKS